MHINSSGIEDVNNIAKNNQIENKNIKLESTKEIEVINKPKSEGFNLQSKNIGQNDNKPKKKKKLCSIL